MKRKATAVERLWAYLRVGDAERADANPSRTAFILLFTEAVSEVIEKEDCECR